MKFWVKLESAPDSSALKIVLPDGEVDSGDIDVSDIITKIPTVLDVGGRAPSCIKLLKYAPTTIAAAASTNNSHHDDGEHSNLTSLKEVLQQATALVIAAQAAPLQPPVAEPSETLEDGEDEVSVVQPATPIVIANLPMPTLIFSVRLLDPLPDVTATPAPTPQPTPRSTIGSSSSSRPTTTKSTATAPPRKVSAPAASRGGWSTIPSRPTTSSVSAVTAAPPVPKSSYGRQPSTSGRVSLMDRSSTYGKTKAGGEKVEGGEEEEGSRSGPTTTTKRVLTRMPSSSRGASPMVRVPSSSVRSTSATSKPKPKAAPTPVVKTAATKVPSRAATPTRRLSEARPGEVPPLAAPSPRQSAAGPSTASGGHNDTDEEELPPPSPEPSDDDDDLPPPPTDVPTSVTHTTTSVTPLRSLGNSSSSPNNRQPFDRQLSRSSMAATPRSRSAQYAPETNDLSFKGNHSTNSSHHHDSEVTPPEYVSRLYPDPEEEKRKEQEAKRRALLTKPQVSPAEKKERLIQQKDSTNRMYNAHKGFGAEACDEFKPLWGQPTCARCSQIRSAHDLKKREKEREARRKTLTPPPEEEEEVDSRASSSFNRNKSSAANRGGATGSLVTRSTPTRRPTSTVRASPAPSSATPTQRPSSVTRTTTKTATTTAASRRIASSSPNPTSRQTPTRPSTSSSNGVKAVAGRGTPNRPPMSPMRRLGSTSGKTAQQTPTSSRKAAPPSAKPSPKTTSKSKLSPPPPLEDPVVDQKDEDPNESFYLSKEGSPVIMSNSPSTTPVATSLAVEATAAAGDEEDGYVNQHRDVADDSVAVKEECEEERLQRQADENETLRLAYEQEQRESTPEGAGTMSSTIGRQQLEMTPGTAMLMGGASPDYDKLFAASYKKQEDEDDDLKQEATVATTATHEENDAVDIEESNNNEEKALDLNGDGEEDDLPPPPSPVLDAATLDNTTVDVGGSEPPLNLTNTNVIHHNPSPPPLLDDDTTTTTQEVASPEIRRPESGGGGVAAPLSTSSEAAGNRTTAPPSASPPFDPFGDIDEDVEREEHEKHIAEEKSNGGGSQEQSAIPVEAAAVVSDDEDAFAFLNESVNHETTLAPSVEPFPQPRGGTFEEEEAVARTCIINNEVNEHNAVSTASSNAPKEEGSTAAVKPQRASSRTRGPRSGSTPRCSSVPGSRGTSPNATGFKRQNSWRQATCHHHQLEDAGLSNGATRSPRQLSSSVEATNGGVPPLSPSLTPRDLSAPAPEGGEEETGAGGGVQSSFSPDSTTVNEEAEGRPTLPPPGEEEKKEEEETLPPPPADDDESKAHPSPLSGVAAFLAESEADGVEHVDPCYLPPRSPARVATPGTSGPPSPQSVSRTSSLGKISRTVFEEY